MRDDVSNFHDQDTMQSILRHTNLALTLAIFTI